MKTIKINHRLNLLILGLLILMGLLAAINSAFGQKMDAPQKYGAEPPVDIYFDFVNDSAGVRIRAKEAVEMISVAIDPITGNKEVRERKIVNGDCAITFYEKNVVFLRTKHGIASVMFISEGDDFAYALVNGKLVMTYNQYAVSYDLAGVSKDNFKKMQDWQWDEKYLTP